MLIFVFRRLRNKYNNLLIGYNVRYLSRNSVIFVTTRSQDNKHFKYNIKLPNVTEVKDLGIIVDHELKFKRHIQDIITRAHQRASLILRCFKSKDPFYCSRHL